MWEGDCQVVCVNNKKIIGLCSPWAFWDWVGHGPGITHN